MHSHLKFALCWLLVVPAFGCGHGLAAPGEAPRVVVAAENERVLGLDTASFKGRWEAVYEQHDGRFQGSSVRSFHSGDCISFLFSGRQFRIYGVSGPRGGYALVSMPGTKNATVSFYSPQKRTHALLYESPAFSQGIHSAALVVEGLRAPRSLGAYVNVDELEIVKAQPETR
jgi:hypothetical protein